MLHCILTRQTADRLIPILTEAGYSDSNSTVVIRQPGESVQALAEASRVPIDTLILDLALGQGLGSAVLGYKLRTSSVQRIILLALGAAPGHPEVARVAQAQVYDIVTDLTSLPAVIDRPAAKLQDAARWLDPQTAPMQPVATRGVVAGTEAPATAEAAASVVYRDRLIGTSVVTVASLGRGQGSTTAALQIAFCLADYGSVALVEMSRYPAFHAFDQIALSKPAVKVFGQATTTVSYVESVENLMLRPDIRQHQYIVADLGSYIETQASGVEYHPHAAEMLRSSVSVLVAGSWPWQLYDLRYLLGPSSPARLDEWNLLLREPADRKFARQIAGDCKSVALMPVVNNPGILTTEAREAIEPMLTAITPRAEARPRQKRLFARG